MSTASTIEREMLVLINQERTSRGLEPLRLELRLNDAAEDHSSWMLAQDVFSHTGSGGSSAGDRMESAGFQFSGSWTWAENIAWQSERGASHLSDDVVNLHNNLMNSSGHRANILNPNMTVVGIGIERGSFDGWDAVMVTQVFARTSAALQIDTGTVQDNSGGPTDGADTLSLSTAGTLAGLAGNDALTGSMGNDKLSGGGGHDAIAGAGGSDTVAGGGGNDRIWGGGGNDWIYGGGGNDKLNGSGGNDFLVGRQGSDIFIFSTGRDVVRDFNAFDAAEDIDLSRANGIFGFNDLRTNHMSQSGNNVVIEDDSGHSMILRDVHLSDLDASDFLF